MRAVLAIVLLLAPLAPSRAEPVQRWAVETPAPGKPAPAMPSLGPSNGVIAQALAERWSKCTVAASERYEKLSATVGDVVNAAFGACKNGELALRFFLLAEGLTPPAADGVIERLRTNARESLSSRLLGRRGPQSAPAPGAPAPTSRGKDPGERV